MKVIIVFALLATALAMPQQYGQQQRYSDAPAQYNYDYKVQDDYSGVDFGQTESRDGANTQGSYYVVLPDGRTQRVTYSVSGDGGYVAEVTYEGEAQYPSSRPHQQQQQQQPTYQPSQRRY